MDGRDFVDIILSDVEQKKAQLKQKRWKVTFAGKEVIIREQLNKIIKAVQVSKDLGSAIAGLDPLHAGLPWAGICFLMQIALGDFDQYTSMVAAVEEVSAIIARYQHVEYVCQRRNDVTLRKEFEGPLLTLYKHILRFQVSAGCYYGRKSILNFLRSIPKMDDVSGALDDIRSSDVACSALGQVFDTKDNLLRHYELTTLLKASKEALDTIMEEVRHLANSEAEKQDTPIHVPFAFDADPKFTGRSNVIKHLDEGFQSYRRMALLGWAGVGKSQIAIEYAHRVHKDKPSTRIFWVRGARSDAFLKSYRSIARKLRIPRSDDPDIDSGELLSEWLCDPANGKWLMVLDNVDDETVFSTCYDMNDLDDQEMSFKTPHLLEYLPQVSHGSILVTSRNRLAARDITNEDDSIILVERLPDTDAMSLLRKKLPKDQSPDKDAKELLILLENLPLAITQAAAYISSRGPGWMTISGYLKLFRSDQVRYLEMAANDIRRDTGGLDRDFSNSVLKTWFISFKHIKERHPDAAENLCFMSLVFGKDIPFEYILCGKEVNQHEVEEGIGPLVEFQLISKEIGGTYSIHRLVQLSVQNWLRANDELTRNVETAVRALYNRFPPADNENWKICESLMPHIDVILTYELSTLDGWENLSLLLADSAEYLLSRGSWVLALQRASKAHEIAVNHFGESFHKTQYWSERVKIQALQRLGKSKQAEDLARSFALKSKACYKESDEKNIAAIDLLSHVLRFSGRYPEAEAVSRDALQLAEKHLGKDHRLVSLILGELAMILLKLADFSTACEMMETLVDRSTDSSVPGHKTTLTLVQDYGVVLTFSGRPEEAERLLWKTYCQRVDMLTEDHPDTILTLANHAIALILLDRPLEAEKENKRALDLMERNALEGYPLLHILHNKGYILLQLDQAIEAKECLQEVLALRELKLGISHPETLLTVLTLGQCELRLGNHIAAEFQIARALEHFRRTLGEDHYHTMFATNSLALLWKLQGKLNESEKSTRESLARSQRVLGADNPITLEIQDQLAGVLCAAKQYTSAIETIKDALKISSQKCQQIDNLNLKLTHRYASIIDEIPSMYNEAAFTYRGLIERYESFPNRCGSYIAGARRGYCLLLCKLSRFEEAETLARKNIESCKKSLGTHHRTTCSALSVLAFILAQERSVISGDQISTLDRSDGRMLFALRESRLQESIELRKQVIEVNKDMFEENGESTLRARSELAGFLRDQGEKDESLKIFQDVFERRIELLGPEHPETLESAHGIADMLWRTSRTTEAESLCRRTWYSRSRILGDDSEATMDSKNNLALCMRDLKKAEQALQLDEELLADKIRVYGPDSLFTSHTKNNLAMDLYDLQDYVKARSLLEEVLIERREKLGANHRDTLLSLSNLGLTLQKQEKWPEAESVFQELLAIRLSQYGHVHRLIHDVLDKLSTCLRKQGRAKEATELYENALLNHKKTLGDNHTKTISIMECLAVEQYLSDEESEAESTYREALLLRKQTPMKDLKAKLGSFRTFGMILSSRKKFSEAEPFCRKAYKGRQVILGLDHEDTLFSAWSLISCLSAQGKFTEAEQLCHITIALREATVGKSHRQTLLVLGQLSNIYFAQRKTAENITQLEMMVERFEENKKELDYHRQILQSIVNAHYSSHHYMETELYLKKYLQLQEETCGYESVEAQTVLDQLAALTWNQGNFRQASEYFRRTLHIHKAHGKTNDEKYLTNLTSLSETLFSIQELDEARLLCLEAIALDKTLSSSTRLPVSFHNRARISRLLFGLRKYEEAEQIASSVVADGEKTLPPKHVAILGSRRQIAKIMWRTGRQDQALNLMRDVFWRDVELRGKGDRNTLQSAGIYGRMLGESGKLWEGEMILRVTLAKMERELGTRSPWTVETRSDYIVLLITASMKGRKGNNEDQD